MSLAGLRLRREQGMYTWLRAAADRRQARRTLAAGGRVRPEHLLTGERGEDAAFFYLREQGYTVVARRWTSPRVRGDLDLVAWDGDTVVVVEVKTRRARDLAPAETAVDRDKQQQLRKLGRVWLQQLPKRYRDRVPLRFDVLAVYLLAGTAQEAAQFEHFPAMFSATAPPRRLWRAA